MPREPFDARAAAVRIIKRTRTDRGLPPTITDEVVLRRVAVLMQRPKQVSA
jgi:hypothetical protein